MGYLNALAPRKAQNATRSSSCVLNNGYASKHFQPECGVRQGCPLSGTLFVIAIELLAQSIRRSKEMKGITIDKHNEVELSQYADDKTVLLSDVQSASKLFDNYRFSKGALV